jgi:hypothetical protein
MVAPLIKRTPIQSVVKNQLPEHIREDYPTFVAFVEAYYEYMQRNGVDLKQIRDIDETLEDFIGQFKKELAHNLPIVVEDERFLLSRIKDQYLSKGSEASYKLLFKLLFGKNVELTYPGRSMLVASDGRWNQEISVFAQIDYGNPEDIVGKLVDIQTAGRILRVLVDRKEELVGEVDRIVKIGKSFEIQTTASSGSTTLTVASPAGIEINQLVTGTGIPLGTRVTKVEGSIITISKATTAVVNNLLIFSNELYEFFLDKRFFGVVNPGDLIKYRDEFQARIVPATQKLAITQPGKNFRVGQVFELRSGSGTGALMKVTSTSDNGGIKYAEFIKFGLGYNANFALSILATNDVISSSTVNIVGTSTLTQLNTYESSTSGTISATTSSTSVTGVGTNFGQVGGVQVGDEIWTTDATPNLVGIVKTVTSTTALTLVGLPAEHGLGITSNYSGGYVFRNKRSVGSLYAPGGTQGYTYTPTISDRTEGFSEQGYVNLADYVTYEYVDGTYAGSVLREFSLNFRNAQVNADDPAVIAIDLGAIVRYPGFFESNNGFVSDSIYIQDSRYYQAFSYVVRIDEKLSSYKSAVKTMLHPAGMALFGEFQITNEYDLSVELESLVKSLGIGLEDGFSVLDSISDISIYSGKVIFDTLDTPNDEAILKVSFKTFDDSVSQTDSTTLNIEKLFNGTSLNYDGVAEGQSVTMLSTSTTLDVSKSLETTYTGMVDEFTHLIDKSLSDSFALADVTSIGATKYLETQYSGLSFTESGQVWLNPYAEEDYFLTPTDYNEFVGETF